MKCAGVYTVTSPSGGLYVGSAVHLANRWRVHRHHLRHSTHPNKILQSAWDKYGEDNLRFAVLIVCSRSDVLLYEQRAIDVLHPRYNIVQLAGNTTGYRHTPEARTAFTAARTGVKRGPMTEEHKRRFRDAQVGKKRKPISAAHRQRLSEFNKTRMADPAARAHLSRLNTGKRLTEEHKRKIGIANSRLRHADNDV